MPDTANLLAGTPTRTPPSNDHPQMMHARMWQHVSGMDPDGMDATMQKTAATLPLIGTLAANPKVTMRDVMRAAADATAAGHIEPSDAVKFITAMPTEKEQLRPWLRRVYQANMSALVHMKAAVMAREAPPPQAAPGAGAVGNPLQAPGAPL